jgi:F1F0 ATPase subunit 2
MREASILAFALLAGILLGTIFYGGLWWTIRRSASSKNLGAWLVGGFLLRATMAVSSFYLVARDDWRSLAACLLGFLIGRIAVTWLTRAPPDTKTRFAQGTVP